MLGPLLLFLCAFLWGTSFVAQKASTQCLGPFAVIFSRGVLAAIFLWSWARLAHGKGFTRTTWIGGLLMGVLLFLAMLAQQIGLAATTPGISAFLTSNYMLIVPILGIFMGRRTGWIAWAGVAVALTGSFFICTDPTSSGPFTIGRGELWTLLCAFLFSLQILSVDHFAPHTDPIAFSCVSQIAIMGCSLPFLFMESETVHYTHEALVSAIGPVLYLGLVSSGLAYTLQILGQVRTPPTLASILMSLESVFGALAGYVVLGDVLTLRQLIGCGLLFLAATITPILLARQPQPSPQN